MLPQLKRHYIVSYVIAIGLIVLITVLGHVAVMKAVQHERGTAEIVNISGKQRMLSQRLLALVETQSGDRGREENAVLIRAAADELVQAHDRLQDFARSLPQGAIRAELLALYDAPQTGVTAMIEEYVAIARSSLDAGASIADRQRMEDLALGELFIQLHRAVGLYEQHAEMGLSRISRIQLVHALLILVVLIAEAVFIFRPLINRTMKAMSQEQETRQIAEDALRFQTETLASKSRFLLQMKDTFFRPLAEAQEKLDQAARSDPETAPELVREARDAVTFAAKRALSLIRTYDETDPDGSSALTSARSQTPPAA